MNVNSQPRNIIETEYGLLPRLFFHTLSLLSFCTSDGFCRQLFSKAVRYTILTSSGDSVINHRSVRQQKAYRAAVERGDVAVKVGEEHAKFDWSN